MSKTPIIRQVAWTAAIGQIVAMILVTTIAASFAGPDYCDIVVFASLGLFVAYALLSRELIAREHRRAIRLVKARQFHEAIEHFERSYDFFTRHALLDKFRSIVLLSASSASYREMALVNIAFCYSQSGNGDKAKQYYRKALEPFPDSGLAQTGINMASAFEAKTVRGPGVAGSEEIPSEGAERCDDI